MGKHKIIFARPGFSSEKTKYKAGEVVEVFFNFVATDTNYDFFVDADSHTIEYDNGRYRITFVMPDRDVTISYQSRNTMIFTPERER